MDRHLFTWLCIPLSIFAALSIVLSIMVESDGFFVNLASELIGIIITVIYVDWIIKKNENEKWQKVDNKISHAIRILINDTIGTIRESFGYGTDIINCHVGEAFAADPKNLKLMYDELIRISKEILEPNALNKVNLLKKEERQALMERLQSLYETDIKLLTIYGPKLSAEQYEILIEIQEIMGDIIVHYSIWPDIGEFSENERLKDMRVPCAEIRKCMNENLAEHIIKLLIKIRELESSLRD